MFPSSARLFLRCYTSGMKKLSKQRVQAVMTSRLDVIGDSRRRPIPAVNRLTGSPMCRCAMIAQAGHIGLEIVSLLLFRCGLGYLPRVPAWLEASSSFLHSCLARIDHSLNEPLDCMHGSISPIGVTVEGVRPPGFQ